MINARGWIVLALSVAVLMTVCGRARADQPIPCWKVDALVTWAGSEAEAIRIARKHVYSQSQIDEARKRCR